MISKRGTAWLAGLVLTPAMVLSMGMTAPAGTDAGSGESLDAIKEEFKAARAERALSIDRCLGWIDRLNAISEANPGTDEGFESLTFVIDIYGSRKAGEIFRATKEAKARIIDGYSGDVGKMETFLFEYSDDDSRAAVLEKTTSPAVKATCHYIDVNSILSEYRAQIPDDAAARALALCKKITSEYGDAKNSEGLTFAEIVEGDLFQLENLRFGMVAPDIEAADLDGVTFKLSDYRGKVVVLDFWGNW